VLPCVYIKATWFCVKGELHFFYSITIGIKDLICRVTPAPGVNSSGLPGTILRNLHAHQKIDKILVMFISEWGVDSVNCWKGLADEDPNHQMAF
jgi:hypothetical protein